MRIARVHGIVETALPTAGCRSYYGSDTYAAAVAPVQ